MNFASDNTAPVAPAILDALAEASRGYARGYGNDDWTRAAERKFCEIFERDVATFLVPTGTAANALALAQVSPPWGAIFSHAESHIHTDECGAPEFFGNGLKLVGLAGAAGKITADGLQAALAGYGGHSPHQVIPAALSITQATEAGTIYRTNEIAALAQIRAAAVARGAHGWRPLCQCAGPAQCHARRNDLAQRGRRAVARRDQRRCAGSGGCDLFRPRRPPSASAASAAVIFCQSTVSLPHSSRAISATIAGLSSPATPMQRPTNWRRR